MKRVAIIQARMGSKRVPGKTMVDINGKPLIWHIIDRARRSNVDEVALATTDDPKDDILCSYVESLDIPFYRGATNDLYLRFLETAQKTKADIITKIFGDSVCIDPEIINLSLDGLKGSHFCFTVGFPRGLNAYSFTIDRLKWVTRFCRTPEQKEFHHQFMSRGGNVIPCDWDIHGFSFTVDSPEDLEYIRSAYKDLGDYFGYRELIQWAMKKAVTPTSDARIRNI